MEDILASIKRIIADDSQAAAAAISHVEQANAASSAARTAAKPLHLVDSAGHDDAAQPAAEEVLELTQPVDSVGTPMPFPMASETESPSPSLRTRAPAARSDAPASEPAAPLPPRERPVTNEPATPPSPMLSDDAASASRQKLAELSALIVKPEDGASNTLEGLVREMLRPMLKEWLDQHLPAVVDKLVEKEIARLTGRTL